MKRVHTLEFEDFDWFPSELRVPMTNLLVVLSRFAGVTPVLTELVAYALSRSGQTDIVDLGSGSGGVMPDVLRELHRQPENQRVTLTLTDLFPNDKVVASYEGKSEGLQYAAEPVDASVLTDAPPGLRTMCNSFHHMRPEKARGILESAYKNREPLLIYEMVSNRVPLPLWAAQLPIGLPILTLLSLGLTPYVRPLTLPQLALTYGIPLIPMLFAWDGQNSIPRMYQDADIAELLNGLSDEHYVWEVGPAIGRDGKRVGNYIFGYALGPAA